MIGNDVWVNFGSVLDSRLAVFLAVRPLQVAVKAPPGTGKPASPWMLSGWISPHSECT